LGKGGVGDDLKKKEGSFAGCFVLLVEVVAFRGCDFFSFAFYGLQRCFEL
jgi:hypothetical protein